MKKIPVYIINLDRSPDRLAYIRRQFSKIQLPFFRISATDGAKLSPNKLLKFRHESKLSLTHYSLLSDGEIGCSLSQKEAWKRISEEECRAAVVLEDDVKISDDFVSVIHTLYEHMDENIIIDLKGKKGFIELKRCHFPNNISLVHYSTPPLGTQGAIIGKNAAINLCEKVTGFKAPIDNLMQQTYKHGIEIWSLDRGCILHDTEGSGGVSIARKKGFLKKTFKEIMRPFWRMYIRVRNLIYYKF